MKKTLKKYLVFHVSCKSRKGKRRSVCSAHKQTLQNDLIEGRIGSSDEESVKLPFL